MENGIINFFLNVRKQGKVYRQVLTKTLTNQEATRGNMINAISTFFEPAKRGDIAILFISGHGMNTRMGYHFVTYDANVDQRPLVHLGKFLMLSMI